MSALDPRRLRGEAGDLGRWVFWVKLREALDADRPEQIRRLYPLWWLHHGAAHEDHALMTDEFRRCFGDRYTESGYRQLVRDAYRIGFRLHLEELLLGHLTATNWSRYIQIVGRENLDLALSRGRGALVLNPHAGAVMLLIGALGWSGYSYTQYAARGLAPDDVATAHPELFGHSRWRKEVREARESSEDRLPATFITLQTPVRHLFRCLERNEIVGIAFDGRIGRRFVKVPFLGREALINPGPFRMAVQTGAAIVPTLLGCPPNGPNVMELREPLLPEGRSAEELLADFLAQAVEPWLRAHPAEYGLWLLHCRQRAGVDDHPFFLDYAPDDRWRRHVDAAHAGS